MAFLSWTLMWFEAIYGLRVNLEKSALLSMGEVAAVEELALELGCKVGSLPTYYLGLPLGANHKSVTTCDGVDERYHKRLSLWKRNYLSKGGRLILIGSTLSSLLIYFMPLFHLPNTVKKRLERIQRDFLWGGEALDKKIHLVR